MVNINYFGHNGKARFDYYKEEQSAPTQISNPITNPDPRHSVPMNNDWPENWGDTFERSGRPAPSTPAPTGQPEQKPWGQGGLGGLTGEEIELESNSRITRPANGYGQGSLGGLTGEEIELESNSRITRPANGYGQGSLGGLTGDEVELNTNPAEVSNPEEIADLQAKVTTLEGEVKTATQNCATAREGYLKALQEKTTAKKAFEDAINQCKKDKLDFETVMKELKKNPPSHDSIIKYRDAQFKYNKSCAELNRAGLYYRSMNNTLIAKLKDLSAAQTALKSVQGESEALSRAIKRTESRIKIKTNANEGIDKVMNEKEFDPKEFFENAGKKAGKKGWAKAGRIALWTVGTLAVLGGIATCIAALCGAFKKDEAPAPAPAPAPTEEETNPNPAATTETPAVTEEELTEENRRIEEGISTYTYDPQAAFRVQKGDCLWNAVKAILKNKNGKEPTDAQIQQGVYAYMYAHDYEFTPNDGVRGWVPGKEVNQIDLDKPEYQNLVRVGNKVVKRQQ